MPSGGVGVRPHPTALTSVRANDSYGLVLGGVCFASFPPAEVQAGSRGPRMENVWFIAAIWVGLALVATLFAIWFKLSTALSEIVVGTVAQLIIGTFVGAEALAGRSEWV